MILEIVPLLAIYCFGSLAFGAEEPRSKLYREVFSDSEHPLTRDQILKLVKDLKELYQDEPYGVKFNIINEVLDKSEVSENKCKSFLFFGGGDGRFSGHARQLVIDSRELQIHLCKKIWETSLLRSMDTISSSDKVMVSSLIDSMIEANSGRDFTTVWLEMPAENAQEGVLRYMASKRGKPFSKRTKEAEFDDAFDNYVYDPCGRVTDKLSSVANEYIFLLRSTEIANELNPTTLKWAKNNMICLHLRGGGYSTSDIDSFRGNTFKNLVGETKKKHWF